MSQIDFYLPPQAVQPGDFFRGKGDRIDQRRGDRHRLGAEAGAVDGKAYDADFKRWGQGLIRLPTQAFR